jgi:hypothetical protein
MAFVDMFTWFSLASQHVRQAMSGERYGPLHVLEIDGRTALLWPRYDDGLDTLALDMMHANSSWPLACSASPAPSRSSALAARGSGSATEALLGYPHVIARTQANKLAGAAASRDPPDSQ